eukprot:5967111-Prymnesium_polylepis.1
MCIRDRHVCVRTGWRWCRHEGGDGAELEASGPAASGYTDSVCWQCCDDSRMRQRRNLARLRANMQLKLPTDSRTDAETAVFVFSLDTA